MENGIWRAIPVDPGIVLILCVILTIISTVTAVICAARYLKVYRRYDRFMRGKDAETLEGVIRNLLEDSRDLQEDNQAIHSQMEQAVSAVRESFQKFGIVKYNAFKGMGGNLSFAIAILDNNNTGFVLNSVHSRDGCYLYLKDVQEGKTEVLLGEEEREALEQALGYIGKPGRSRKRETEEG